MPSITLSPPGAFLPRCLNQGGPFYDEPGYIPATSRDFKSKTLPPIYTWNTEHKIIRIAKFILSLVLFPIGLYQFLHTLAAKIAILPASNPDLMRLPKDFADTSRAAIPLHTDWKYKRITIEVDGMQIDAVITGKRSTLSNGRWVLFSNGNGEFYENKLYPGGEACKLLTEVQGNGLVFNYPKVGASTGSPSRKNLEKAYRAVLSFLEDKKKGIGAQEIIGYGYSIGGGVQGDALKTHPLKKDIRYVFVKSHTFSNLSKTASLLTSHIPHPFSCQHRFFQIGVPK